MHTLISDDCFEAEVYLSFNFEKIFEMLKFYCMLVILGAEAGLLFNYCENIWYAQP